MKDQVLKECAVVGNTVMLPNGQLDRKVYVDVNKALQGIGGKWNRKANGFVFASDPTDLLAEIAGGKKRNLKKEFQFFATTPELADWLVELARDVIDIVEYAEVCEPSAGDGAIVKAINRVLPDKIVSCYELMPQNQMILADMENVKFMGKDWLKEDDETFDAIIANPPFSKNQDIRHIRHMFDRLKDGGILVSIASEHWVMSGNKKETAFREWLDEVEAEIHDIDRGAFKTSGTMVGAKIIVIYK